MMRRPDNHQCGMEAWRTYTPDGRMLEVEHAAGEWIARCAGRRGSGTSALEAIRAAVATPQASIERENPALEEWLREHAEQLESEVR